jgi:dephospho-CoA kinase
MATTSAAASSPSDQRGYRVGLTGGIGSGKSAVGDRFGELGAAIVDSDEIARALTAPGGAAIEQIRDSFGPQVIDADGALDRAKMRTLAFRDGTAKTRLESILHPLIREITEELAAGAFRTAPYVVLVIPLLIESRSWRRRVDRLLVVDCPLERQKARVVARSGLDPALVDSIIAQQAGRTERLDAADDVLVNDGSLADLTPRVARLHQHYRELAARAAQGL